MFGSQGRGGFGAASTGSGPAGAMATNPFGQQQVGSTPASNPFQSGSAPATMFGGIVLTPAFGQSSGFGSSSVTPFPSGGAALGGSMSAKPTSNPFAPTSSSSNGGGGGSTATTFGASSGFGAPSSSFGALTPATTFGGATNTSSGARSQFGTDSSRGDRAPPTFGNGGGASSSSTAFGSGGGGFSSSIVGPPPPTVATSGSSNGFGFGAGAAKLPGVSTAFGQPVVRSKKPRDGAVPPTAFGLDVSGGFGAPALPPGASTAFGNQTGGIRVRRKSGPPMEGDGAVSSIGDNPFAPSAAAAARSTRTGASAAAFSSDATSIQTAFGQPSRMSPGAVAVSGGAAGALEARLNGTSGPKKPLAKAKRGANGSAAPGGATSIDPSGMMPSKKFAARSGGAKSAFVDGSDMDSGSFPGPISGAKAPHPQQPLARKKALRTAVPEYSPSASPVPSSSPVHSGTSADEPSKAELASAVNLDGTCVDMCSPAERELHIRVDELSAFEKCFPDQPGRESELIIKRFQRSSADHKLDIPSEIRPPGVLRRTQLYIEQAIMDRDRVGADPRLNPPRVPDMIELYNFCWDRFRMLRKDFVLQNYRGAGGRVHPIVLDVHERIARYHILSEHELIEVPSFVAQQNMEQLGQTLKSLNELYDESRKAGDARLQSPFEAEFRAYFILCALDNGRGLDVLKFVKGLPRAIAASAQVAFAMKVFVARHTHDYYQFFALLRGATYLQSCLLFRYIPSVRSGALQRMNRAFRNQSYPLVDAMELLCFDDLNHAAEICQHHGLELTQQDPSDDTSIVIQFGGDFETDIQLRRNKRPLPVRGSHVFVGQKQGEYLRKDICRGVTEYYPEEYPPLSQLIQDLEARERATMYPTRAPYEDEYSSFANYALQSPMPQPPQQTGTAPPLPRAPVHATAAPPPAHATFSGYSYDDSDDSEQRTGSAHQDHHKALELEAIARRKAELERTHQLALQRIQELERTKHAKARAAAEPKAVSPPTPPPQSSNAPASDPLAQERADKNAALLRMQQELEAKLREQEQQRRERERLAKQQAEQAAAAAETARREKEAEQRRQAIAAEQARKQLEAEQRAEDARRCAAEVRERERQQQLAEEQERRRLDAALETQRQQALTRERAEQKRLQRLAKQRTAVLQLHFRLWTKYVRASRALPPPLQLDASRFAAHSSATPQFKPKSAIQWLFKDERAAAAVGTRLRHPSEVIAVRTAANDALPASTRASSWCALDVLALVAPALRARNPAAPAIQWKFAVGDLVDSQSSSFGVWCAAKLGIERTGATAVPFRVFHTSARSTAVSEPSVAVCCRFLDAAAIDSAGSVHGNDDLHMSLRGVSALLLPLSLSEILDAGKRARWMQRIESLVVTMLAPPIPTHDVVAVLLLYANVEASLQTRDAVAAIESFMRSLQVRRTDALARVDYALVSGCSGDNADTIKPNDNDDTPAMVRELAQVIESLARESRAPPRVVTLAAKELLEGAVSSAMQRCALSASPTALQDAVCAALRGVRDDLVHERERSDAAIKATAAVPELQGLGADPTTGSGSSQWDALASVLVALEAVRIEIPVLELACSDVCDRFFAAIAGFVDRVFTTHAAAAQVSTHEIKKLLYNLLVPVHERLVTNSNAAQLSASAAAAALPWRQIFEEVYSAFFETLDDLSVTVSATWRSRGLLGLASEPLVGAAAAGTAVVTEPNALVRRPAPGFANGLVCASSQHEADAAVPRVSSRSLKRSFGVALASSSVLSAPSRVAAAIAKQRHAHAAVMSQSTAIREDPRVARLSQEIARERAASARFQQLLRREVSRWEVIDDLAAP